MNGLKNKIIYQIFVRNYSKEGKIEEVTNHLDEIISSGADILYLMPVFPIGVKGKKGSYGSPYSIMDYRKVDEDQGGEEQLIQLCDKVHQQGKKIILDMVFNHTSRDSYLSKTHPEYFYKDKDGNFANKIGDWADVIDLKYKNNDGLEDYLVDTLKLYESYGIDGFRFDVASLIPTSFFKKAKASLKKDTILLAECVDTSFVNEARSMNITAYSNQELIFAGFDVLYPYSYFQPLHEFLLTKDSYKLEQFKFAYSLAMASISKDALITMSIENHDRERIASYSEDETFTRSLLAMTFFSMGPAFVYMGEEYKAKHLPSLFEKDVIDKKIIDEEYYDFYIKLVSLKKRKKNLSQLTTLILESEKNTILMKNTFDGQKEEYGLFNFSSKKQGYHIPNGSYIDLLTDVEYTISNNCFESALPHWLIQK